MGWASEKGEAKRDWPKAVKWYLFVGRAAHLGLAGQRTLIHKRLLPLKFPYQVSFFLLNFFFFFFEGEGDRIIPKKVGVRAPGCRDPSHFSDSRSHIWGRGCRLQLDRRGWKLRGTPPPSHPGRPEPPQQQARARQRSRHGAAHGARGDAGRRGRGAGGSRGGNLPGLRTRSSL